MMDVTKSKLVMATKLNKITRLSKQNSSVKFSKLMPHFTEENLRCCFNELDGKKAVGIDGKTKAEYAENLEYNLRDLVRRMKSLSYRPEPVREVAIPKVNGESRTLGISTIEDKLIQLMFSKLLEAIYEPMFCDCSFGFRRNKSAHGALRETVEHLMFNNVKQVIEVDLENFFGTIKHSALMRMLGQRIADQRFLRYISRLLKAGKQTKQGRVSGTMGLPQGSILSPILSNLYAHYVIDLWFAKIVPQHTKGGVKVLRYCDDFIVCCTDTRDTNKVIRSLEKRLAKFGLKLNRAKTKIVNFNRYTFARGEQQGSFNFLGFTFYLSRALKGGFVTVKTKTSKKTLRVKLANVKQWLSHNRFKGGLRDLWLILCRKLQGHVAYFGVTGNGRSVEQFLWAARRLFFKWMNRRSQKRSFNWEQFTVFEKQYPMPRAKIYHGIYKDCPASV